MSKSQSVGNVLFAAFVVVVLVCVGYASASVDPIRMHSLYPPILENYWENGLRFWAFGSGSVVTDQYVRLTTAQPNERGYLWNRHSSIVASFQLNVTMQMRQRESGWFSDTSIGGIAIWNVAEPTRVVETGNDFFGHTPKFHGFGVLLDHGNTLSVVESRGNDAYTAQDIKSLSRGFCSLPSFQEGHVTVSLHYNHNTLSVFYVVHPNEEPNPEDFALSTLCTVIAPISAPETGYFGVTASNSADAHCMHEIHSIFMTPLDGDAKARQLKEENDIAQVRIFRFSEEKEMQKQYDEENGEKRE